MHIAHFNFNLGIYSKIAVSWFPIFDDLNFLGLRIFNVLWGERKLQTRELGKKVAKSEVEIRLGQPAFHY